MPSASDELRIKRQVELLQDLRITHFTSGDVIYREGEPSDTLYIIINLVDSDASLLQQSGADGYASAGEGETIAETQQCAEDKHHMCAFVPAGGIFGELGLIYR